MYINKTTRELGDCVSQFPLNTIDRGGPIMSRIDCIESWIPVVGWEKYYEVSDQGRLRKINGAMVGQWLNQFGYCRARLSNPRKIVLIHRLVAEAFVNNPEKRPFVNHIDSVRNNNVASNLEWCNQQENLLHASNKGRMQRNYWIGKRSPNASLSDEVAIIIRRDYATGKYSMQQLAIKHKTNKKTVCNIINRITYANI